MLSPVVSKMSNMSLQLLFLFVNSNIRSGWSSEWVVLAICILRSVLPEILKMSQLWNLGPRTENKVKSPLTVLIRRFRGGFLIVIVSISSNHISASVTFLFFQALVRGLFFILASPFRPSRTLEAFTAKCALRNGVPYLSSDRPGLWQKRMSYLYYLTMCSRLASKWSCPATRFLRLFCKSNRTVLCG